VNVVADRGAVGGIVIVAEHREIPDRRGLWNADSKALPEQLRFARDQSLRRLEMDDRARARRLSRRLMDSDRLLTLFNAKRRRRIGPHIGELPR